MNSKECRERAKRPSLLPEPLTNIKTCCFFFPLELGCKLIAIFEGLCGFCESILAYKRIRSKDIWNKPIPKAHAALIRNPEVSLFIGLVTLFSAPLLLAGVAYKRKKLVLMWLCVICITTVVFMFYTLAFACIPDTITYDVISAALEVYFMIVVLSYYLQQRHVSAAEDEFDVLYTTSKAQLTSNA